MSRIKLQAAKELIEEKELHAARAILETIPDDETAKKWMKRLPKSKHSSSILRRLMPVWMLMLGILVGILIAPGSGNRRTANVTTQAVATVENNSPSARSEALAPSPSATITETPTPTVTSTPTLTPTATVTPMPTSTSVPLVFTGTAAQVIGPIKIEAGIYRATATTNGFMIVSVTAANGECGAGTGSFLIPSLFILSSGEANVGAEALFTSHNCTALIEISNVQEAWSLEFERVT